MSGSFTSVNLAKLPAPAIIEVIDFETMFGEMLARLRAIDPMFDALVESDPTYKILEVVTYYRMLDRQRVNDAARGVMLAYAVGPDLDNLGALVNVPRLQLDAGDPDRGIPPTMEDHEDYRRRIQLAPEGFSVAGPEGAYTFHALSADSRVLDASATSPTPDDIRAIVSDVLFANAAAPELVSAMDAALDAADWPGDVTVSILSRDGDGTAAADLLSDVAAKLSAADTRPLTDHVSVQSASITEYAVAATVYTFAGPDSGVVLAESKARLEAYISESHRMGRDVTRSGLFAALHSPGVQRVDLVLPAADIVVDRASATFCTGYTITHGGIDE